MHPTPEDALPRIHRPAVALALLLVTVSLPLSRAHAARAYLVESDFATGSCSGVNVATHVPACDVASVHSDARVRWYGGRVYLVNRFGADNIQVLDGDTYALVRQFSVGNGSNPYDIAFDSGTHAYVTRYESPDLWVVNPATGAHTGTISLAALADADGIPEMDRMIKVGPLLFVSLQRVNRNAGFQPTDTSLVAVIDTRTDALVDCDAAHPGVQGILLPHANPVTAFVFDAARTRLYLGCAGSYGVNDGGIVRVDPAALVADGVIASESMLGGDPLDLVWAGDEQAYAIVSDASFNTQLIRWSPTTGQRLATLYSPGGFTLADAEITPAGDELWVCNSSFAEPGVHVFDTATGLALGSVITCTLPPQGVSFDRDTEVVAGVGGRLPALAFAPPSPNPTRGPVRLSLAIESAGLLHPDGPDGSGVGSVNIVVDIVDVAGRHVRSLTRLANSGGALEVVWDLLDDSAHRVPPGVYLAAVRSRGEVRARRVLVLP